MKQKNNLTRAIAVAMALALVTTSLFAITIAKYSTSGTSSHTARVAKWGVEVSALREEELFKAQYVSNTKKITYEDKLIPERFFADIFDLPTSTALFSVLLLDGRILIETYPDPDSDFVGLGIYDPATNTYSDRLALGKTVFQFTGGVLLPDGRVVLIPRESKNIGIYDPTTNIYTNGPAHNRPISVGKPAFKNGVLLPNGKVAMIPSSTGGIGIYDPETNTYTEGPDINSFPPGGFCEGVLLPDGRIVIVPYGTGKITIYDPETNTYTDGPTINNINAFKSGVLLSDGRVLMIPWGGNKIAIYDSETNTYTDGPNIEGRYYTFEDGVLLSDGRVLMIPSTMKESEIKIYDPETNTFTNSPTINSLYNSFKDGVLLPDGRIVMFYVNSGRNTICIYEPEHIVSAELESEIITINSNDVDPVFAPGSFGSDTFSLSGKPEVATNINISCNVVSENFSVHDGDAEVSYNPLLWTLKKGNSIICDKVQLEDLSANLENLSGTYPPNTDFGEIYGEYEVSWEYPFGVNDLYDTLLAEQNATLSLGLDITVTQID